jgi:hypothetical protein
MRLLVPLAPAVVALVVLPGAAVASHNGPPTLDHYVQLGEGFLIANPGGHEVLWERCPPAPATCAPYDDGDGNAQRLLVRDAVPGTTFRATQDGVTLRSEAWRGPVRVVAPPRVEGEIRVGGHVRPVAAGWEGGWGRERDWLQLQACPTEAYAGCKVVLDAIKFGPCPPGDGGRLLPARYEGWWLRVADSRIDRSQPFTAEGYFAPEGVRPLPPAPGIAVATAGRIAPGAAPATDCGRPPPALAPPTPPPAPSAIVRRVVRRAERGRLVAVRASCAARCALRLVVRQGRRTVTIRRRLAKGTTTVAIPRAASRRLRSGVIRVRVVVDGRQVAAARAILRLG